MSQPPIFRQPASPELLPDSDPPSPADQSDFTTAAPADPPVSTPAAPAYPPDSVPAFPADPPESTSSSPANSDSETFTEPASTVDVETRDYDLDSSSVTTTAPRARRGIPELEDGLVGRSSALPCGLSRRRASAREVDNTRTSSGSAAEGAGPSSQDDYTRASERSNTIQLLTEDSVSDSRNSDEPPAKIRKLSSPSPTEDMDGETCPICLDSWGNSGEHRLVALKCGHLFGDGCVQRWLKAHPLRNRCCPTCKSKANIRDLRFIYARRLVAADTTQITCLQKQIETLQAEKNRTELELQKSKISHRAVSMQLEVLRSLMKSQTDKEQPARKSWRFALEKNLEICKDGGCRVLTYNYRTYELYVSQKSGNYLFPGYGIRKISCLDYKPGQFVHLHPKPIRDIAYSQPKDLLLSVGLDSTARVVERGIPAVTVNTGVPLWSCSWDHLRGNEFYVGGVGGIIQQYDVRNPSESIRTLSAPGDLSPVVSLRSTEFGLLSCQLNSSRLWVGHDRPWEPRALPVAGSFTSLCYDGEARRALLATRPGAGGAERARLTLCRLRAGGPGGEVAFDVEDTFRGSARASVMTRPCWVKVPGAAWVAAHSESDAALHLHGLDGARTVALPAAEPALDVACVHLDSATILASLSGCRLRVYKAVPTGT